MSRDSRRRTIVVGLLLGLLAALPMLRANPTAGNKPPSPARVPRVEPAEKRGGAPEFPRFRQELVDVPLPPYPRERSNLFGAPPRPAPPPPAPASPPSPPAPVVLPPPPPDPFYEEVGLYRLFGTAEEPGGAEAFVGRGSELFVLKAEDRLGSHYVVKEVREESVVLRSPEGDKEVVLAMPEPGAQPSAGRRAGPGVRPAPTRHWPPAPAGREGS